ncbi:MAG: restriction endonuclease [Candidatus Bathyarchaeota archaeon]|nr:restriction endonuclease [Candidatus Bathyarchaeota archaeon]
MNIERELIISILKVTKNGSSTIEVLIKEAKIASSIAKDLAKKLQNDGLLYLRNKLVEVDSLKRLKLAVHAIELGADVERVSGFLDWKEFENIAAIAFERNDYSVKRNLRFKHAGRRWEIDIIACKKPIVACVDCKHWHHGMYPSAIRRIVEEQVERTSALAESLPKLTEKIECTSWSRVKLVPAILSLTTVRSKFYNKVPIVPVLQLQDFISQLPAYVDSLKHFSRRLAN